MKNFRKLDVWKKSHELVKCVYKFTLEFPTNEQYGLTSQLRRASISIPTNIVEGCGRGTDTDFARFIQIAIGSACEVEYLLILSKELQLGAEDEYSLLVKEVVAIRRMLIMLLKKLRN